MEEGDMAYLYACESMQNTFRTLFVKRRVSLRHSMFTCSLGGLR
jgi:hypothetical protein